QVRAHNDTARMAAGAAPAFKGAEFEAALTLPQRDPVSFRETKKIAAKTIELPEALEFLKGPLGDLLPDLAGGKEYLVSVAVYRVDESEAAARLHMRIRVGVAEDYRSVLVSMLPVLAIASGIGILTLAVLMTLILLLPIFRGSAKAVAQAPRSASQVEKQKPVQKQKQEQKQKQDPELEQKAAAVVMAPVAVDPTPTPQART